MGQYFKAAPFRVYNLSSNFIYVGYFLIKAAPFRVYQPVTILSILGTFLDKLDKLT